MLSIETLIQNGSSFEVAESIIRESGYELSTLSGEIVEAEAFGEAMTTVNANREAERLIFVETVETLGLITSITDSMAVLLPEEFNAGELLRAAGSSKATEIVFLSEGDPNADRDSFDRVAVVVQTFEALGREVKPVWLPGATPGTFLGAVEGLSERAEIFERALTANRKIGRAPARQKRAAVQKVSAGRPRIAASINWDEAIITLPTFEGMPDEVIAYFAARIVSSRTRRSRENEETYVWHQLEVRIAGFDEIFTVEVEDSQLEKVNLWLKQLRSQNGRPVGTLIERSPDVRADRIIAFAIRGDASREREWVSTLSHGGWVMEGGEPVYVSGAGAVSRFGFTPAPEAIFTDAQEEGSNVKGQGQLMLIAPLLKSEEPEEARAEAQAAVLTFHRYLSTMSAEHALLLLGYTFGCMAPGGKIAGGIILTGPKQAGKSESIRKVQAMQGGSATIENGLGVSSEISAPVLRDSVISVSEATVYLDDIMKAASGDEAKTQVIDSLIRLATDGPAAAGFMRKTLNSSGRWVQTRLSTNRVGMCLTDERMPLLKEASAFQRTLSWEFTRETAWREGADVSEWDLGPDSRSYEIADQLHLAFGLIFEKAATRIWLSPTALTGQLAKTEAEETERDRRQAWTDALLLEDGLSKTDTRGIKLAAMILSGWEVLSQAFASVTGSLTLPGFDMSTEEGRKEAVRFMASVIVNHRTTVEPLAASSVMMTTGGLLEEIASLLSSGRAFIAGGYSAGVGAAVTIGRHGFKKTRTNHEGVAFEQVYVAIDPNALETVVRPGAAPRPASLLKSLLLAVPGALTEQVRINGGKPTAVLIPIEAMPVATAPEEDF